MIMFSKISVADPILGGGSQKHDIDSIIFVSIFTGSREPWLEASFAFRVSVTETEKYER